MSMMDTIIAVALNKHESSTSKKLGKLIADNVAHNSRTAVIAITRKVRRQNRLDNAGMQS
jgi:hypothetical protein